MRMRHARMLCSLAFMTFATGVAAGAEAESPTFSNGEHRWHRSDVVVIQSFDRRNPPVVSFPRPKKILGCMLDEVPCPLSMKMPLKADSGTPRSRVFILQWRDEAGSHLIRIRLLARLNGFKVEGRSELKKHVIFANDGVIGALSPKGELDYYRQFDTGIIDFRPQSVGGKTFYTYGVIRDFNLGVNSMASHVVLDDKMKTVETHERVVDSHEFLLLGRRHYLFTDYVTANRESDDKCLLKQYLIEEKNGRDIYTLSTDDLLALHVLPDYGSTTRYNGKDCLQNGHLNGVSVVDSNRWLVSFGDGAIFMWLKKERRPEWILGGEFDQFGLKPEQRTNLHHTPQWSESKKSLLVFDNGHKDKKSRLLEYFLDPKSKTLRELKIIPIGTDFSIAGGSVEREGKVTSIGWGFWEKAEHDFVELVDGKVTMSIRFCETCDKGQAYRIYRGPFR